MSKELITTNGAAPVEIAPMTPEDMQLQVNAIQRIMKQVMHEGVHYGLIPGCGPKPALLKAGAEKLCMTFRLIPYFEIEREDLPNGHLRYTIICTLKTPNGLIMGQGVGLSTTLETKHRYRGGQRKCPECHKETIIKGKDQYGGGWICYAKKGGCGHKWPDGAKEIEGQEIGRIENPDIADTYNTVLKMGKKRAHVDATITATAASDIFTQDIEEMGEGIDPSGQPLPPTPPEPKAKGPQTFSPADEDQRPDIEKRKASMVWVYNIAKLAGNQKTMAEKLLEAVSASWDDEERCWFSTVEIPRLANCLRKNEEAAHV